MFSFGQNITNKKQKHSAPLRGCAAMRKNIPMTQRHPIQNDVTMLVTTCTHGRVPYFSDPSLAREAIDALYRTQAIRPFFLFAFSVMPDHVHLLVRVPAPETISKIMLTWKTATVTSIGIPKLWQKRYHIRFPKDHVAAKAYVHNNPVKAGLVVSPEEHLWSSGCGLWDLSALDV